MQINLSDDDMKLIVAAMKTALSRTIDSNKTTRLLRLIGRFVREIEQGGS